MDYVLWVVSTNYMVSSFLLKAIHKFEGVGEIS